MRRSITVKAPLTLLNATKDAIKVCRGSKDLALGRVADLLEDVARGRQPITQVGLEIVDLTKAGGGIREALGMLGDLWLDAALGTLTPREATKRVEALRAYGLPRSEAVA